MEFTMVVEDDLAEELCKFKNQKDDNDKKDYDDKIVERILHYYKSPILLSKAYMEKYYDKATLTSILSSANNIDFSKSLEQLASETIYKVILSQEKNNFPYINIYGDKIENNLTATFLKQDEKTKAKEHFKALFANAKTLFVYDNYLNLDPENKHNVDSFKKFAQECFPRRQLEIFHPLGGKNTNKSNNSESSQVFPAEEIKSICQDWKIKEDRKLREYRKLHDRYIIVDEKIQIILTSGIDNLMGTGKFAKDFTYIIRLLTKQPILQ